MPENFLKRINSHLFRHTLSARHYVKEPFICCCGVVAAAPYSLVHSHVHHTSTNANLGGKPATNMTTHYTAFMYFDCRSYTINININLVCTSLKWSTPPHVNILLSDCLNLYAYIDFKLMATLVITFTYPSCRTCIDAHRIHNQ